MTTDLTASNLSDSSLQALRLIIPDSSVASTASSIAVPSRRTSEDFQLPMPVSPVSIVSPGGSDDMRMLPMALPALLRSTSLLTSTSAEPRRLASAASYAASIDHGAHQEHLELVARMSPPMHDDFDHEMVNPSGFYNTDESSSSTLVLNKSSSSSETLNAEAPNGSCSISQMSTIRTEEVELPSDACLNKSSTTEAFHGHDAALLEELKRDAAVARKWCKAHPAGDQEGKREPERPSPFAGYKAAMVSATKDTEAFRCPYAGTAAWTRSRPSLLHGAYVFPRIGERRIDSSVQDEAAAYAARVFAMHHQLAEADDVDDNLSLLANAAPLSGAATEDQARTTPLPLTDKRLTLLGRVRRAINNKRARNATSPSAPDNLGYNADQEMDSMSDKDQAARESDFELVSNDIPTCENGMIDIHSNGEDVDEEEGRQAKRGRFPVVRFFRRTSYDSALANDDDEIHAFETFVRPPLVQGTGRIPPHMRIARGGRLISPYPTPAREFTNLDLETAFATAANARLTVPAV
ncbi:hypothetical protein PYCC9005_001663 [Savitreella phatthalungensis]